MESMPLFALIVSTDGMIGKSDTPLVFGVLLVHTVTGVCWDS